MESTTNPAQTKQPKRTIEELTAEVNERIAVLQQKPEISSKTEYYKGMLVLTGKFKEAIDTRISYYEELAKTENKNYDYEICKLQMEKLDADTKLVSQKQFFEMWLKRSKDFTLMVESITQETNRDFDMILSKAQGLATPDSYLEKQIQHYLATVISDVDKSELDKQTLKNEFFLFIKYEVDKIDAKRKFN